MRALHRSSMLCAVLVLAGCTDDPLRPVGAAERNAPGPRLRPGSPVTGGSWEVDVSVQNLGTLGDGHTGPRDPRFPDFSSASAINDRRLVVGSSSGSVPSHAPFRWTTATGMQLPAGGTGHAYGAVAVNNDGLAVAPAPYVISFIIRADGSTYPMAYINQLPWSLNDEGTIVGEETYPYPREAGTPAYQHAVVWTSPWVTAPVFPRDARLYTADVARDINNLGTVVGYFRADGATATHAWRGRVGGVRQQLSVPLGSGSSQAVAVSDADVVVGTVNAQHPITGELEQHAWRWEPDGSGRDLGPAGDASAATDVNAAGDVVGWSGADAVVWSRVGLRIVLPELPEEQGGEPASLRRSIANGVNRHLDVVGMSRNRAVLWRVRFAYQVGVSLTPSDQLNQLTLGSAALIPVGILGSGNLDISKLDAAVLTLGDGDGDDVSAALGQDGKPLSKHEDLNDDGVLDMLVFFDQTALEKHGELTSKTTQLVLFGDLGDGEAIKGVEKVEIK